MSCLKSDDPDLCYQCSLQKLHDDYYHTYGPSTNTDATGAWQNIQIQASGLCLFLVGMYLLFNRNFKKHPYPMLGITCLAESSWIYNFSQFNLIFVAKIYKIFAFSLFFRMDDPKELHFCMSFLIKNYKVFFIACFQVTYVINGLIYLDLYLTLRNPFYPR